MTGSHYLINTVLLTSMGDRDMLTFCIFTSCKTKKITTITLMIVVSHPVASSNPSSCGFTLNLDRKLNTDSK